MQAKPCGTARRSRFFLNSFLRLTGFAGPGVAVVSCGSLATWFPSRIKYWAGCKYSPHLFSRRAASTAPTRELLAGCHLLLGRHGTLARPLARAGIGVRALAADRQIAPVAHAAIALGLDEPANVHLNLLAEIALDAAFGLDGLAQVIDLFFGQVLDLLDRVHLSLAADGTGARLPDSVDGCEAHPQPLVGRQINACNACHTRSLVSSLVSPLALLVLRVAANHPNHPAPVDDLALIANLFDRRAYLHLYSPFLRRLLVAIYDPAARQIVGRQLHRHPVSRQDADEILAHLSGDMRQHPVLVLQFHPKHGVGQRFNDRGHHFDGILLGTAGVGLLLLLWPRPGRTHSSLFLPGRPGIFPGPCENPRAIRGDRDGVLEMSGVAAVGGYRSPVVVQHLHARPAGVHHGLNGKYHSFLEPGTATGLSEVGHIRFLMHPGADAVADKLPHDGETMMFHPLLHGGGDVAQAIACPDLFDGAVQGFSRHTQELFNLRLHAADGNGDRGVGVITLELGAIIKRDDVAFLQPPRRRGYPVHDLLVHRGAEHAGIAPVTLEGRAGAAVRCAPSREILQIERGHAWLHP